jgi:hypothetical protein
MVNFNFFMSSRIHLLVNLIYIYIYYQCKSCLVILTSLLVNIIQPMVKSGRLVKLGESEVVNPQIWAQFALH